MKEMKDPLPSAFWSTISTTPFSMADRIERKSEADFDHVEQTLGSDNQIPVLYDEISYGSTGFKGLVEQPYVFAVAFLASMGRFSFGYGGCTVCRTIPTRRGDDQFQDQGVVSLILTMSQFHTQDPETTPGRPGYGFHTVHPTL